MISMYHNNDFQNLESDWTARNVYYPYDFEAHKNLSHNQFPILVYYFMDYAVRLVQFWAIMCTKCMIVSLLIEIGSLEKSTIPML